MERRATPSLGSHSTQVGAERYRLEGELGHGGMATVYRAVELETGTAVALKRLRPDVLSAENTALVELFEREYLTLCQLAHPRIVRVYDYAIDAQGPYYTMEMLDGGDLQTLAPLPWLRACAIAREIGSAVALIHSRRMVYRDLSPRNVRCTSDGSAKLIDFGAMAPMGPMRELVGTAPCIAPEALNMQPLDARTDLFALGATLYFALLQRHAYPARDLSQLRDIWRSRPRRPSELIAELPPALDQLVMDLLQLDPAMRPANAAEVLERLSAISSVQASEHSLIAQAYLSSPSMVGRQHELSRIRKSTFSTLQKKGGALLLTGAPGVGRSRLLDACVLEAKLAGLLVVRIHGNDTEERAELSVGRAIAKSLLDYARPLAVSAAEDLPILRGFVPELGAAPGTHSERPPPDHAQLQRALQAWILTVSRRKPLLIAVDDFASLDERSAALLAVLSEATQNSGVLLAVTVADGEALLSMRAALRLLERNSDRIALEALTADQLKELLASMFGDVPNLAALANYLHGVAGGNPRESMLLAQQLVSEGLIQYSGGAWSLPDRVHLNVLPASLRDTLGERARRLSPSAHRLALAFALEPKLRFSFEECLALAPELEPRALFRILEDLVLDGVLLLAGMRYGLRQEAWVDALTDAADAALQRGVHASLAEVLRQRGDEFRASGHLFAAGELARGLDMLLEHVEVTTRATEVDANVFFELLKQLPSHWLQLYERALEACRELDRPARDSALLLSRLEGLISHAISDVCAYDHIQGRLEQLSAQCGLDIFASLPSDMDVVERMKAAFGAASARFEALPDKARVYQPGPAIKQFAQSLLSAIGVIAFTHDVAALQRLPSAAPLAALFPAMAVVRDLVEGVRARITGRTERALAVYGVLLSGPFAATSNDLSRAYQTATRLRLTMSVATLEAGMGLSRSIERLVEVEAQPTHAAQAMLVRHLYFAWQGDLHEADRCKRQAEVLQLQSSSHHGFEGQHLFSELCAYALCDDLTRVKRSMDLIESRVRTHAAWKPMLHYARGEFQRIRGDLALARSEFEAALSLGGAGEHPLWAMVAGAHLRVCVELGEYQRAVEDGEMYLGQAERAELGYACAYVAMPLSLALAHSARYEEASRIAEGALQTFVDLGATGLNLALAYETRARVALLADNREQFEADKRRAAEVWPRAEKRLLRALAQTAQRPSLEFDFVEEREIVSQFVSKLGSCDSQSTRAQCGLSFMVEQSRAQGGLLYVCGQSGLVRTAAVGSVEPSEALDARAAGYLDEQLEQDGCTDTEDLGAVSSVRTEGKSAGIEVRPVLLMHQSARSLCITGVALLLFDTSTDFRHPARLAGELSRALLEHDDAVALET